MRFGLVILFVILSGWCHGQKTGELHLRGVYTMEDSIQITKSYYRAHDAMHQLLDIVNEIWSVEPDLGDSKNALRKQRWLEEEAFSIWLGEPDRIRMVRKKIRRIHKKFRRNLTLVATPEDRGVCDRWTGAWSIPFGKIRIRICENFFNSVHLQEKIIIHELGHEAGILSHHGIHNCWGALRAAATSGSNVAKHSTENYAWLAVSYLGIDCTY